MEKENHRYMYMCRQRQHDEQIYRIFGTSTQGNCIHGIKQTRGLGTGRSIDNRCVAAVKVEGDRNFLIRAEHLSQQSIFLSNVLVISSPTF